MPFKLSQNCLSARLMCTNIQRSPDPLAVRWGGNEGKSEGKGEKNCRYGKMTKEGRNVTG